MLAGVVTTISFLLLAARQEPRTPTGA
jgi:hypothetical protein